MSEGYIKLHRCVRECKLWEDEERFDKRSAWIDLLLSATHTEKSFLIGMTKYTIQPGQLHTSIEKLAVKWHWNRKTVMRYLTLLESEGMIRQERTPKGTTLTIVKWAFYQGLSDSDGQQNGQLDGHPKGQLMGHIQEYIYKEKDIPKGISKKKFVKPTVEEVRAYCLERKNKVDPERFFDFYESKGWMVGKSPMKDWKACVRNWEKDDSKKPSQKKTVTSNRFNNFDARQYDYSNLEQQILSAQRTRDG